MKKAAILLIYIALLLCVRWFWSDTFGTEQQPKVENGVLDLRGIHLDDRHSIVLDGEWEFYPDMLISGNRQADQAKDGRRYIQVPGDWSTAWPDTNGSSFGYGTYRLRILVDQPLNQPYELWVKEIKAASTVIVNGKTVGKFGNPAATEQEYTPELVSFINTFVPDKQNVIDIMIQSANYSDPTSGGSSNPCGSARRRRSIFSGGIRSAFSFPFS